PDRGRVFRSVLDGKERFMVRDLPANHEHPGGIPGMGHPPCRMRWTLGADQQKDQWPLDGMLEAREGNGKPAMRPMKHEPESDGLDLWSLAATWATGPFAAFGRWQVSERRLAVPFEGLAEGELDTFCKTLSLGRVEIPGKGAFEDVSVEDVPVG